MASTTRRVINGEAVRAIREAIGVSQASLARRVEISKNHLSMVESGKSGASGDVTRRIATELGVSFEAITQVIVARVPA